MRWFRLAFGFSEPVVRSTYVAAGLGLMLLLYALDAGLTFAATGRLVAPWVFFNPVLSMRHAELSPAPDWLLPALLVVALPFAWIGASMSTRRAIDAGRSPWLGLLFFVPGANWLLMAFLAGAPGRSAPAPAAVLALDDAGRVPSALLAIVASVGLALSMVALSVYGLGSYGASLFFLTPVLMGVSAGFLFNRRHLRSPWETIALALASVAVTGGLLLLFAVEGVLCLTMAAPLAFFFVWLGAALGRELAARAQGGGRPLVASLVVLPLLAGGESGLDAPRLHVVETSVEVDAPAASVWSHVIAFPPLAPPTEWFFRAGIAYPTGASIDGTGIGAVRRCAFSTGSFVEPITTWDPPSRLAFDVASTPPSMTEWSPYADLRPPHVHGGLVSKRGEFRLDALDGGRRTRLTGSTTYTLAVAPEAYWRIYAEWLLHRIHERVLQHIAARAESARGPEPSLAATDDAS